jgi:DNA mismatch repair ATPase MutS
VRLREFERSGRVRSVVRGSRIVQASQTHHTHLILFDEWFRGTNAVERIAASDATLRELAGTTHIVVAATHDVEIVALLDGVYASFHLVDRIEPSGLVFEYRFAPGSSTTRNAITLLELNGAPVTLVQRARERFEYLSKARYSMAPSIAIGPELQDE